MITGIGTDVCRIGRIEAVLEKFGPKFLERILTPKEREGHWGARQLARRWAMKEAVAKATGHGIGAELSFQDIEIMRDAKGKPVCRVRGYDHMTIFVSASDDGDYATGMAVIEAGS